MSMWPTTKKAVYKYFIYTNFRFRPSVSIMMIAWTSKSSIFTILIQPVWARQHCCPSFQSKLRVLLAVEGALGGGCLFWVVGGGAVMQQCKSVVSNYRQNSLWSWISVQLSHPATKFWPWGWQGKDCIINTLLLVPPSGHSNSSVNLDSNNK